MRTLASRILKWLTEPLKVGVILGLLGIVLVILNLRDLQGLLENFGSQLIGIAFTIIVIDRIYDLRTRHERKQQLIRQMGNKDNGLASFAIAELRAEGWLEDGSLRGAGFWEANLENADLWGADLQHAEFGNACLKGASLIR